MQVTSTGFRTDLMVRRLEGSVITERPGYLTVRTPANPTFWWGNFVLVPEAALADGPAALVALFEAEFPGAGHIAIGVDAQRDDPAARLRFTEFGLTADVMTVLTATGLGDPPHPAAADIRALAGDSDFAQLAALRAADPAASGGEPESEFARARLAAQRATVQAGHGAWLGAFRDGRLLSGLGVFSDGGGVARYQDVATHPAARRQGLAGTLVRAAAGYARAELGAQTLVIVADPAGPAISSYRAAGFTGHEAQVSLQHTDPTRARPA
jgi:ribosomal protein S18 acetylase RimI-like enzyme